MTCSAAPGGHALPIPPGATLSKANEQARSGFDTFRQHGGVNDRATVPAECIKAEVSIGAVASRRRDVLGSSGRPRLAHATLINV